MKTLAIISALFLISISKLSAQTTMTAKEAAHHIGEKVTVCDSVFRQHANAFYVTLHLGEDYPPDVLVVSIRFARKFRDTLSKNYFNFRGKKICVTGVVRKGAYIKVNDPAQIRLQTTTP